MYGRPSPSLGLIPPVSASTMSLAATCPKCSTMFRVVADQLKLHQGAVRCGSCGTVFNAAERLAYVPDGSIASRRLTQPVAVRSSERVQSPAPLRPAFDSTASEMGSAANPDKPETLGNGVDNTESGRLTDPMPESQRDADDGVAGIHSLHKDKDAVLSEPATEPITEPKQAGYALSGPEAADAGDVLPEAQTADERHEDSKADRMAVTDSPPIFRLKPEAPMRHPPPEAQIVEAPDFSVTTDLASAFLEREAQAARDTRRARVLAFSGVLVAAVALTTQGAYWWRNELASALPGSKPWLTALCRPLNCSIELPAHGERLALDSLQIAQASGATRYQVSLIIRNQSTLQQRAPHLELTLTSANGDAVMRRALAPQEWLPAAIATSGLQPSTELPVRFSLSADQPFTGFTGRLVFAPVP